MMVRIPRKIRFAAPAIFTTVNACDDARSTAERPKAAAAACTSKPEHVPAEVASPERRPPANVFRATRVMSVAGCHDHERRDREEPEEVHDPRVA